MTIIIGTVNKKAKDNEIKVSVLSDVRISSGYSSYSDTEVKNKVLSPNNNLLVGLTGHAAIFNYIKNDLFGLSEVDVLNDNNLDEICNRIKDKLDEDGFVLTKKPKKNLNMFGYKDGEYIEKTYKIIGTLLLIDNKGHIYKIFINDKGVKYEEFKNAKHQIVGNGEREALGYLDAYEDLSAKNKKDLGKNKLDVLKDAYDYICNTKPGVGGKPNFSTLTADGNYENIKLEY